MIRPLFFIFATGFLFCFGLVPLSVATEQADESLTVIDSAPQPPLSKKEAAKKEKELQLYSDFSRFAESWVQRLNASHSQGREHMVVVKEGDVYRARYHHIEKKSAVVRESPSRPGQYTGILRYQDMVYQAEGETEAMTKNGTFSPVPGSAKAVSEIFQMMGGAWK